MTETPCGALLIPSLPLPRGNHSTALGDSHAYYYFHMVYRIPKLYTILFKLI